MGRTFLESRTAVDPDELNELEATLAAAALTAPNNSPFVSGYHAATRDHPFLDMSPGLTARIADANVMAEYLRDDEYPSVFLDFEAASRHQLEDALDLDIDHIRASTLHQIALMLSGTFGVRRHVATYFDPESDYHQVELLLKSIPSGGARHPTECFVEVHRSPSLPTGTYHYNARRGSLDLLKSSTDGSWRTEASFNSPADWAVGVVLASRVDRAMFRYRDPRSMRAILVDAGHADAQIAALAAFCNWRYTSKLDIDLEFDPVAGRDAEMNMPALVSGLMEGYE